MSKRLVCIVSSGLAAISQTLRACLIICFRGYRLLISPLFGSCCRFYPSCSAYAIQALQQHGFFRGLWLIIKRLARCHPAHPGGVDQVPSS